jgi:hypothetical protein
LRAAPGNRIDDSAHNFPDAAVVAVDDLQVARRIQRQTDRKVELCAGGRTFVSAETVAAVAGDRRSRPVRKLAETWAACFRVESARRAVKWNW